MTVQRKGMPGKGPEVGVRLACARFGKEAGVAAAE